MLHTLLWILKIIGIILLAILGILISLLLIVLFVPVRYEIRAESKGDLKSTRLDVRFSWLLHLLAGQVSYVDEKLDWRIRILWKKILPSEETEKTDTPGEQKEAVEEAQPEKETAPEKKEIPQTEKKEETQEPVEKEETTEKSDAKESKIEKIKCTIKKVCDKIKLVYEFLKGKDHQEAFVRIKNELIRLLMYLKPKKVEGKVHFGMEDPYQTGQILAVLSVLYPLYAEHVEIYPDFEEKIIEGDLYIKGRVRVMYFVIVALRIIVDKNVRMTIKDIKTLL